MRWLLVPWGVAMPGRAAAACGTSAMVSMMSCCGFAATRRHGAAAHGASARLAAHDITKRHDPTCTPLHSHKLR